jgi:hypothetical protein
MSFPGAGAFTAIWRAALVEPVFETILLGPLMPSSVRPSRCKERGRPDKASCGHVGVQR